MSLRQHVRPDNWEAREFSIGSRFKTTTRLATQHDGVTDIGEIGMVTDIVLRTASPYTLVVLSFLVTDSIVHMHPSSMTPDKLERVHL